MVTHNHSQIFETNSSYSREITQYGKSLISVFQEFFASINKVFIWQGDWALGYHSIRFKNLALSWYFLISQDPKS